MSQSERIDWIDLAKGVSIVLVVLFHASITLDKYDLTGDIYWLENEFFSPIRMPVFFLASGILARKIIHRSWGEIVQRKVLFLLYVFVLWSILHLVWDQLMPYAPDPERNKWVSFVYSPSSVLWFVWALALYFVIAKGGLLLGKGAVLAGAVGLSVLSYTHVLHFENFAHNNVLQFLPFFLCGAWYSDRLLSSPALGWTGTAMAASLLFAASFALYYETKSLLPESVGSFAVFPLSMMGIVVGISCSMVASRFAALKALPIYLGKNTLPIYVAHAPIIGLLAFALPVSTGELPLAEFWSVPMVTGAAIALSLILKVGLNKVGGWWLYALPPLSRGDGAEVGVRST